MDFSFLTNLLSKPTNHVVGIDIGSAFIKVTQLSKQKGKINLDTYGEMDLGSYDDNVPRGGITNLEIEKLTDPIDRILTEARITAKYAVVAIPSRESLIFTLKFPNIKERELPSAIQNEAKRYIPVPLSEVTLDWWLIPSIGKEGDTPTAEKRANVQVLVAAVRNEFLAQYEELFKKNKKIEKYAFELDVFGSIRSSLKHELSPSLVLDFGASGVRFSVIEYGVMKKFHSINRGGYHLTDALARELNIEFEKAEDLKKEIGLRAKEGNEQGAQAANILRSNLGFFFNELRNFLINFERVEGRSVRKILLIGGGVLLRGLRAEIEADFNIETLLADPFDRADAPDFLEGILDEAGPEFAVSLGMALKPLS